MWQVAPSPKFTPVFELQAILRKMHQMTPKSPWTLKGHRYPKHILKLLPESQISLRFDLKKAIFELQAT